MTANMDSKYFGLYFNENLKHFIDFLRRFGFYYFTPYFLYNSIQSNLIKMLRKIFKTKVHVLMIVMNVNKKCWFPSKWQVEWQHCTFRSLANNLFDWPWWKVLRICLVDTWQQTHIIKFKLLISRMYVLVAVCVFLRAWIVRSSRIRPKNTNVYSKFNEIFIVE